jgi:hypothetical protein
LFNIVASIFTELLHCRRPRAWRFGMRGWQQKKFWSGYRTEKDLREREEIAEVRSQLLERLTQLIRTGAHEAEPEYVVVLKQIRQDISEGELREWIKRYHDAVNARQSLDRESL